MITGNIPPIDGGGRVPQPIKPDPNKNGQNVGPTVSQDMALIVAQSGQVFYVPTQILPDDNSDRGRDNYTPSNKSTHKEKNTTDSSLHFPTNNKEFKNLATTVTNWIKSMQDNLPVAEGPAQDPNNVVLGAADEVHYVEPPTVNYTSTVSGDNKVSEFVDSWSDFISNFDFTTMSGSKGMVAWAMMMNYVKSAIWASALTSGDIEALMEQFKAMIEQLKSTADTKKKLALAQADQVGKQIEALDTDGMAAISAAWHSVSASIMGTFFALGANMSKDIKKNNVDHLTGSSEMKGPNKWINDRGDFKQARDGNKGKNKLLTDISSPAEKLEIPTNVAVTIKEYPLTDQEKAEDVIFRGDDLHGNRKITPKSLKELISKQGDEFGDAASNENQTAEIAKIAINQRNDLLKELGIQSDEYDQILNKEQSHEKAINALGIKNVIEQEVIRYREDIDKVEVYDALNKSINKDLDILIASKDPGTDPTAEEIESIFVGKLQNCETTYAGKLKALDSWTKDLETKTGIKLQTRQSNKLPQTDTLPEDKKLELESLKKKWEDELYGVTTTPSQEQNSMFHARIEAHLLSKGIDPVYAHSEAKRLAPEVNNEYKKNEIVRRGNPAPMYDSPEAIQKKEELFQKIMQKEGANESFRVLGHNPAVLIARIKGDAVNGHKNALDDMTRKVAVDLQRRDQGLKDVVDAKRFNEQAISRARARSKPHSFTFDIVRDIMQTLSQFFKTQQELYNLNKQRTDLVTETAKQLISGEREASSQMLEGMLQIMQKVLDALVQMNQNLRQTATQSAASLQISTF